MAETLSVSITDNVSDTLFIPLYMRSLETQRADGIINDPLACRLVERIDYDFEKYASDNTSQVGTAIRIRCFDKAVADFVAGHENPVVVSVGAGLDTRFQRVYQGKGVFYELDIPEVIDLRRELLPESENNPYIALSMFDTSWMDRIAADHPGASFILVAEGVFMYFKEEEIHRLLVEIGARIPQGELHFDACSPWAARNSDKHGSVSKSKGEFQWGLDSDRTLETWSPYLHYLGASHYMSQERKRWGLLWSLAGFLPMMKKSFRMLHYAITPKA